MPEPLPQSGEEKPTLRRRPIQKRSRERVERILSVAVEQIAEKGSDAIKMSEIAKLAGISIGSLYQYFPDKSAIIRTLAEQYNEDCRHCVADGLAAVQTIDALCAAFDQLIDEYYALFLAEPVIRDVRMATLVDKALQDIELEDTRYNGRVLAQAMLRARPDADPTEVESTAFYIMHMGEATLRLAITVEAEEGRRLVETYKHMVRAALRGE